MEDVLWKISYCFLDVIVIGVRMVCLLLFCCWFIMYYLVICVILFVIFLLMVMCCMWKVIWCVLNFVFCIVWNLILCDLKNCSIISWLIVIEDWICVVLLVRSVVIFIRSDRWEELVKICYLSVFGMFFW